MHEILIIGGPGDWPPGWDLAPYQVELIEQCTAGRLAAAAGAVVIVPHSLEQLQGALAALEVQHQQGAVALLLAAPGNLRGLDGLLRQHLFDGFLDLRWPAALARASIETTLRSVELGRNVVEIQRAVLEHSRTEAAALYDLAVHDDLTQLYNHRHLTGMMTREHDRSSRCGMPYALLFVDLDNLKQLNTRYGHESGSQALREVAAVLRKSLRADDVALRIGGDEFVLFLAGCDKVAASVLSNSVCERLRRHSLMVGASSVSITVSVGVASFPEDGVHYSELLRRADFALLAAKAQGRDRVVLWTPELEPTSLPLPGVACR